jgi:hypothetical protein
VGAAALGLPLYVFPRQLAQLCGLAGDDLFVYQLGGAAMLGYAVALPLGVRRGDWPGLRYNVLATYLFAAIAFLDGLVAFGSGVVSGFVVLVSLWAVLVAWTTGQLVASRWGTRAGARDVAAWVVAVLALATMSAAVFGLGPQLARPFAALMGYLGTDEYVYRLAGAACFGYAAMGVAELRSLHWHDLRLPNEMALVFNALAFVVSLLEIVAGHITLLAVLVALAAGFFTISIAAILARRGR